MTEPTPTKSKQFPWIRVALALAVSFILIIVALTYGLISYGAGQVSEHLGKDVSYHGVVMTKRGFGLHYRVDSEFAALSDLITYVYMIPSGDIFMKLQGSDTMIRDD